MVRSVISNRFILTEGFYSVAPAELEAVLLENPLVADAGVIGIEDAYDKNELPRSVSHYINVLVF